MAVLCHAREYWKMKMNQYQDGSEPFSMLYSTNDAVDQIEQGAELDRSRHDRVFGIGNSPRSPDAGIVANRRPFPLRTLMVCFTIWLIATQAMIFDQIKFDERVHLLEQEARSLGVPQVLVPNEPRSSLPTGATVQRL